MFAGIEGEDLLATVPEAVRAAGMRDVAGYLDSLKNFDILGQAGKAMDLDFIRHCRAPDRSNHYLILEGKKPGERMNLGQRMTLDSLRDEGPRFTVVVVYYDKPADGFSCTGSWNGRFTLDEMKGKIETWFTTLKQNV